MARKPRYEEEEQELNLAPIMNMVMILIPLLLLSVEFSKAGVINITSPRNAQSTQADPEEVEESEPVPKVVVTISSDGFRIFNQNPEISLEDFAEWSAPVDGCAGGGGDAAASANPYDQASMPATICLLPNTEGEPLVDRLNFAALYNRLAEIKLQDEWFDRFEEEGNSVVSILADNEIPFEVVVKTMDAARFFLNPTCSKNAENRTVCTNENLAAPTASDPDTNYLLGGGSNPTMQQFEEATLVRSGVETNDFMLKYAPLFPDPVLLLPRPGSGE